MGIYVCNQNVLRDIMEEHRTEKRVIVSVNGCFDILHAAHIRLLQESKKLGDILVVGLNTDRSVQRIKSKARPFVDLMNRAQAIAAFNCVDYVTAFDEDTPCEWLRIIKPDIHVNDASYGEDCVEAPVLKEFGGRLHLVEKYRDISTTDIARMVYNKCQENGGFPD